MSHTSCNESGGEEGDVLDTVGLGGFGAEDSVFTQEAKVWEGKPGEGLERKEPFVALSKL